MCVQVVLLVLLTAALRACGAQAASLNATATTTSASTRLAHFQSFNEVPQPSKDAWLAMWSTHAYNM